MAEAQPGPLVCSCCGQIVENASALLDAANQTVTTALGHRRFTKQEYRLIDVLHRSFSNTVTKEQIYDRAFADAHGEGPDMKIVDVVVCRVRKGLSAIGLIIETKWGVGYRLIAEDPAIAEHIKRTGISNRLGRHTWTPEHDVQLRDLMRRKFTLTACAQALGMPYMATERAMKRLNETPQQEVPSHG